MVYKVTNTINGQVYIGATKDSLEKRKKDHLQKANMEAGHKFQEAIRTYGPEAFSWEQIDTATDPNELAEKEVNYIQTYNSKITGYNSDNGGGIKKLVYQYNGETGELLQSFVDLESAGNAVNVSKKSISKACLGIQKSCAGYYWSYFIIKNHKFIMDKRKKKVLQYEPGTDYQTRFGSVAEAARTLGLNKSSIAKCCRGESRSVGDYFFMYED